MGSSQTKSLSTLAVIRGYAIALTCLVIGTLCVSDGLAQPFQAADLRSQTITTAPPQFEILGVLGDLLYFHAYTQDHGVALWRTDGTDEGTELVRDPWPGEGGEAPEFSSGGRTFDGHLYFGAEDSLAGEELWQSDGTPNGTFLVSDSRPGPSAPSCLTQPPSPPNAPPPDPICPTAIPLGSVGDGFLYSSEDPVHGLELWFTDQSPGGAQFVRNLAPGPEGSEILNVSRLGNLAIFTEQHYPFGRNLYASDGTEAGTVLLFSGIGIEPDGSELSNIPVLGNYAYFWGYTPSTGYEIWKTDGTPSGTSLFIDQSPGPLSSDPSWMVSDGSHLYFQANNQAYISDGTVTGTVSLTTLTSQSHASPFYFRRAPNGDLYFFANDPEEQFELHVSDLTLGGTRRLLETLGYFASDYRWPQLLGNDLLYQVFDRRNQRFRAWVSDGSTAGTYRLRPSTFGLPPLYGVLSEYYEVGGQIYFTASSTPDVPLLWTSDGTSAGTHPILSIDRNYGSNPSDAVALGDLVLWRATDDSTNLGLWALDPASGAQRLLAGGQGQQAAVTQPRYTIVLGPQVYFAATTATSGDELFITDGTIAGTTQVTDLPGTGSIVELRQAEGWLFFNYDGPDQREPWISDGTGPGTRQLADLRTPSGGSNPFDFTSVTGTPRVVFSASLSSADRELFVTDGTTTGTQLLQAIDPDPSRGSEPTQFTAALGRVFFTADPDASGRELFVTDGTAVGTAQLTDRPIDASIPGPDQLLESSLGRLFFTATTDLHGRELWTSDGTAAGTRMVLDTYPGTHSSRPQILGDYLGLLWFIAFDGATSQLYSTDGTVAGTTAIVSLERTALDGVTGFGQVFDGHLYFSGWDIANGVELWSTDGTSANTGPVSDINSGHGAANPKELLVAGGFLSFYASSGADREPWVLPASDWIFGDGIETLDASRWDDAREFGAELFYNTAAASLGVGGLEVTVDADKDKAFLVDQSPEDETTYRSSFFFDPNGMVFPENKRLKIFSTRTITNKRHIEAMLRWRSATGYQLRVKTHHENLSDWFGTNWISIDPSGNQLTIEWQQASAPATADGVLKLWVDGVLVETVNGIINGDLPGTDWVQLGVVGGVTPGISGSHYFDDFRSWSSLLP